MNAHFQQLAQAYKIIAVRHLDMAQILVPEYADGAVFHIYHAFESIAAAALASRQIAAARLDHREKISRFQQVFTGTIFMSQVAAAAPLLESVRNNALYPVDRSASPVVTEPHMRWTQADAQSLLAQIQATVESIVTELRL